jgi:hypothetical protein
MERKANVAVKGDEMLETVEEIYKSRKVIAIICDKCEQKINDKTEMQEVFMLRHEGGYNSIFGDCANVECDICQYCLKEMVEDIARIT